MILPNGTISPNNNPQAVWGLNEDNEVVLCQKGDKNQLVFKGLQPTFQPQHFMKMTLKSHPGKAICLSTNQPKHAEWGLEKYIKLGDAGNALSVFMDSHGHIHSQAQPGLCFDAYGQKTREAISFDKAAGIHQAPMLFSA